MDNFKTTFQLNVVLMSQLTLRKPQNSVVSLALIASISRSELVIICIFAITHK
jgi:hypothetical protein